jgi:SPP1 gp7 family putative phage head morphogenesis protein
MNAMSGAVHKEFMKQYRATMKMLNSKDALKKLYEYAKKAHPEIYKDVEKRKKGSLAICPNCGHQFNYCSVPEAGMGWVQCEICRHPVTQDDLVINKSFKKPNKKDLEEVDKWFTGWDKNVNQEMMQKILGLYGIKAATIGGNAALNKLGIRIAFHLKDSALIKELKERGAEITGAISESTLEDFRRVLYVSYMEEGISPYEVKKRIEGMFKETYRNRAMAIARTETGIASSMAQHKTYEENMIEKKEWLATMDDKTRESHAEANGQVVPIDEPFQVGDAELMHPLDPSGPPEEICNCRCDELPVIEQKITADEAWTGG